MTETTIELIQLDNGDIALRQAKTTNEPLVTLSFSKDLDELLAGVKWDIAKNMMEAGIQRFQAIQNARLQEIQEQSSVLH